MSSSGRAEGSWRALLARGNRANAAILSGGVAVHAVNVFLAATVLPSVVEDIGGARMYAWAATVFVLASVLGSTLAPTAAAAHGPRAAFTAGGLALAAGSVACAGADTMTLFLVGRVGQGIGGGMLFATSYALIAACFEESLWPRATALVSAMWGVATVVGPALGGTFAEFGAWRIAFVLVVPASLVTVALARRTLPASPPSAPAPDVPWRSIGLLAGAVLVVSAASTSTRAPVGVAGVAIAAALIACWLRRERTAQRHLLPRTTFAADATLRRTYVVMALLVLGTSVEFFVPLLAQRLQAVGPLAAGYVGAAMAAGWTAGSIGASSVPRHAAALLRAAPLAATAGLLVLAAAAPQRTQWAIIPVVAGLTLVGLGVGLAWPQLLTTVLRVTPRDERALAGSSITTVQMVTGSLGAALAGVVTAVAGVGDAATVGRAAFWLFLVFSLAPAAALLLLRRR